MPPEAFLGAINSSPSLDVWAIGLMFYAMLYGTLPFYSSDETVLKQKIRNAKLVFPNEVAVTDMGKELLTLMLKRDPKERLELLDFMSMEYYNIDDHDFEQLAQECQQEKDQELAQQAEIQKVKDQKDQLAA